jgi:hypothetical protein
MKEVLFIKGFEVKYKGELHTVECLNADKTTCVLVKNGERISAIARDVIEENENETPKQGKKVKPE